jgi:hypothetical protein
MNTINFDQLYQSLLTGAESIAKTSFLQYFNQAKSDGTATLESMKDNLQLWTTAVQTGAMTAEDLSYLVKEQADLDKMIALKQAGLAEVQLDAFKNALVNLVIGTIASVIKV